MKSTTIIFCIYLLLLPCVPCADTIECGEPVQTAVSQADNHRQHDHNTEACTPFCCCTCCAVSVFYPGIHKTQFSNVLFQRDYHKLYDAVFNTNVISSIWQPPKSA